MRSAEVGDEIVTTAGIYGTIIDIDDEDDTLDRRDRAGHPDPDGARRDRASHHRGRRRGVRRGRDDETPTRRRRRDRRSAGSDPAVVTDHDHPLDPSATRRAAAADRTGAPRARAPTPGSDGAVGHAGGRSGERGAVAVHRLRRPRDGGDGLHRARVPPREPRREDRLPGAAPPRYTEREATLASVAGYLHDVGQRPRPRRPRSDGRDHRLPGAPRDR